MSPYPSTSRGRDRFVLDRRPMRPAPDPWRHQGWIVEDERAADGRPVRTATIFLTGRECPWRCVMCDLWQYTIAGETPVGAIPAQLAAARDELRARGEAIVHVKLYNAGSFFDPGAVPEADYEDIARRLSGLGHVTVESHPALIGRRVDRFMAALSSSAGAGAPPALEVAMGLETVHPTALERLHKGMTLSLFRRAADGLARRGVALRAFLLIGPPFVAPEAQHDWLLKSIDVARECGATAVSLIPIRGGNGAMEALAASGDAQPITIEEVEASAALALRHVRGPRIFVDLWDLRRLARCAGCFEARRDRLHAMNLAQAVLPPVDCAVCGAPSVP